MTARSVNHNWNRPTESEPMTDTQPDLNQALAVTKPGNSVAKLSPKQAIKNEVEAYKNEIKRALPDGFAGGSERFARTVLSVVANDKTGQLIKCSPRSIIGAALQAAQLGLAPGVLGEAWLVAYKGECTFQVGYKGLISLAARAGVTIQAHTVYDRDEFDYELGLNPTLHHKPATGDRGKGVYWYAVARDRASGQLMGFAVVDRFEVEKLRKMNPAVKAGKRSPWDDHYDSMALTKAVRAVCKFLPMSVDMGAAIASDGVVRTEIDAQPDEFQSPYDDDIIDGEVVE